MALCNIANYGFGYCEKSKKESKYREMNCITVSSHKENPIPGVIVGFHRVFSTNSHGFLMVNGCF